MRKVQEPKPKSSKPKHLNLEIKEICRTAWKEKPRKNMIAERQVKEEMQVASGFLSPRVGDPAELGSHGLGPGSCL